MSEHFTSIEVKPLQREGTSKVKASGTAVVAGILTVRFTVSDGKNGLWVKLPQHTFEGTNRETGKKETFYVKDVKIIDEGLYKEFTDLVISEYHRVAGESNDARPARDNKPFG